MEELFPSIIMGLREANSSQNKIWQQIMTTELKPFLNNEKFNQDIESWINNELKDCTIQPITRYGDTDSVFCDFQFYYDCKHVSKNKGLKLWKKIMTFGKELIKENCY